MRIVFALVLSGCCQVMFGQFEPQWEWAISVPSMGGTSEMRGVTADAEGNTIVVGQINEPFSGQVRGGAVAKYDAAGVQVWNYNIPYATYNGSTFMDAVCDDDQNVYAVIVYDFKALEVEGDSVEESDMALLKFNKNGELQFIKAIGSNGVNKLFGLSIQNNELIVNAFGSGAFDREGISYNFPSWGRPFLMAFDLDGALVNSGVCGLGLYEELRWVKKEGNNYFAYVSDITVKKTLMDTSTGIPTVVATLDLVEDGMSSGTAITDVVITQSGRVFASGYIGGAYILLDGDTIYNINNGYPTCFILELDDSLKVKNHILYYDENGINLVQQALIQRLEVFKDEKIAVKNWFRYKLVFPNDSLDGVNTKQAASIVELNLDLTVRSMNQVNVWDQPGWVSWDFDYDGLGNLYCLFQHEEDMYFDSIWVKSANKSWAHLSVIGKLKTGATVSVEEVPSASNVRVYPNPASDHINISIDDQIGSIRCLDISGKTVISTQMLGSNQLDVSGLQVGTYIMEITDQHGMKSYARFVKALENR